MPGERIFPRQGWNAPDAATLQVMKDKAVTWKNYIYAGVGSAGIPFLALLLQTGWTFLAHSNRLYQASLNQTNLASPLFWTGDCVLGLLIFLCLCLVIKNPVRCWIVAATFLVGMTCFLIMICNSVVYK
jgi:hypothetical protein